MRSFAPAVLPIFRTQTRLRVIATVGSAVTLLTALLSVSPANATDTYLPWPGAASCGAYDTAGITSGTFPGNNTWTLRRLEVTSSVTVTAAEALLLRNPSTTPTVIDIRANDASVGTSSWALIGSLTQSTFNATGSLYTTTYSGAVSLTPGTYWIGVRGTSGTNPGQSVCVTDSGSSQSPWYINNASSADWYITQNNGTSYSSGTAGNYVPFVSLSGSTSSPGSSSGSFAPAPLLQQFGKPSSGTCDAAAPATLNWSSVSAGGWSESWAQWVNNGNGGAVCTRTLSYSTTQSRWVVN
jgi:hypothetical protein